MVKVRSVKPEHGISKVLTGARFVDAYRATEAAGGMDATSAARLMLGRPPKWVDRLLRLRNALVTPLGLKTGRQIDDCRKAIGILLIVSATPSRVVLGLEDKHLDFRLVIDVVGAGGVSEVTDPGATAQFVGPTLSDDNTSVPQIDCVVAAEAHGDDVSAPNGNRNALKHGRYAGEAVARRREIAELLRAMRQLARPSIWRRLLERHRLPTIRVPDLTTLWLSKSQFSVQRRSHSANSSSNAFACFKSSASKPSVNQAYTGVRRSRASSRFP
jgi:Protein of unknown function (DUF2867)